jgi:hypothetical protein
MSYRNCPSLAVQPFQQFSLLCEHCSKSPSSSCVISAQMQRAVTQQPRHVRLHTLDANLFAVRSECTAHTDTRHPRRKRPPMAGIASPGRICACGDAESTSVALCTSRNSPLSTAIRLLCTTVTDMSQCAMPLHSRNRFARRSKERQVNCNDALQIANQQMTTHSIKVCACDVCVFQYPKRGNSKWVTAPPKEPHSVFLVRFVDNCVERAGSVDVGIEKDLFRELGYRWR